MKREGFVVDDAFEEAESLAKAMVGGLTVDQRWLSMDKMAAEGKRPRTHEQPPTATPVFAFGVADRTHSATTVRSRPARLAT